MGKKTGFSLIELMIVIAIISFLAMIAIPNFIRFLGKAKRVEAYINLNSIYSAEKAYWAEHGRYSDILNGDGGIGWQPEGYSTGGKNERFYYTYGFAQGVEGKNYFTGKLETSFTYLSQSQADKDNFIVVAAGDIMSNGKPDILIIDQTGNIKITNDALS